MHLFSFRTSQWQYVALCWCWCSYTSKGLNRSGTDGLLWVHTKYLTSHFITAWWCWCTKRITHNVYRTDESSLLHLFLSSCVPVVSTSELLCAVIVTCCIAKLTQGGLLYGGDRPGRCGKPCKHGTDHCHTEGLDCGYNRLQQRSLGWWEDSLMVNAHT